MANAFPRAKPLIRAFAATAVSTIALLTGASVAEAACASQTTTKAYSSFGDLADYVLAPGGNFESGAAAWTLTGASMTSGTAPFSGGSKTDRSSLTLTGKGRAVSPKFCVGVEHPNFRLQARMASGSWAQLLVKIRWSQSGTSQVNETVVGSLTGGGYAKWLPTPSLKLAQTLPLTGIGQTVTAQIVLDPEDAGGSWQVDNVYVDPLRRS